MTETAPAGQLPIGTLYLDPATGDTYRVHRYYDDLPAMEAARVAALRRGVTISREEYDAVPKAMSWERHYAGGGISGVSEEIDPDAIGLTLVWSPASVATATAIAGGER